jgi:uncharacterized RDD family membrane protein YckC
MPTINEFWQVAAHIASERGGLVVGFPPAGQQPELGSTLDNVLGFKPPQPPTVVRESDWTDWQEQVEAFYRLRPNWGRGKAGDPKAKYYRVKFESLDDAGFRSGRGSLQFADRLDVPSFGGYAATSTALPGVSFWPRALARLIDVVVHRVAGFAAGLTFAFMLTFASAGQPPVWAIRRVTQIHFPVFCAGILGLLFYHVLCVRFHGATLGKLLLSMRVVQDDGSPCSSKSAVIRELALFVDSLFFGIVGYVTMHGDPQQKRNGDEWAHTIVCQADRIQPASRQGAMRFLLGLTLGMGADMALLLLGLLIQMNSVG